MEIYCTRPGCPRPLNVFADLDDSTTLKTVQQKYCTTCGMPLILVGRYLPLKLLGKGGFGAAFLARDRYTPGLRQCVVKQFQPSGDLSPPQLATAQGLFEREAEVLEQLGNNHPQIPNLFAFFSLTVASLQPSKQDEFFYLVQEFIDGQDMEEILAAKGRLSEAEVLEMLLQILEVLQFVHTNGSIHRDIKPSNIMHHRNGRYYLLDFGAVKQVTKSAGGAAKGSTGIYSMGFAPPEQMAGNAVFPSTDLYALAVTTITLLTGKQPADLYDSYNNQWLWRPYAQVSARLEGILDRMLLSTPNQRFQSAEDVVAALTTRPTPAPSAAPTPPAPPAAPVTPPAPVAPVAPSAPPAPPAASATPGSPTPASRPRRPSSVAPFSTLELLGGAAFTGFESSLIAIALMSILQPSPLSLGLSGVIIGGLVFAQARRLIEKADLVIIAGITLGVLWMVPGLQGNWAIAEILVIAGLAGLVTIAITSLFRLIFNLLSRIF